MISEKEVTRVSKFLSLVLRHQPATLGIQLDENGWTDVQQLIEKMNRKGFTLDFQVLQHIVDTNAKKRFSFTSDLKRIRANQGHSVKVELDYAAQTPPTILYHGTAEAFVKSILQSGLHKRGRHHVHLSGDLETAVKVGKRHGKPLVFAVLAGQMHQDGYDFLQSENGVWLTDHVPAKYLVKHIG